VTGRLSVTRWWRAVVPATVAVVTFVGVGEYAAGRVWVNTSPSLPLGVYRVVPGGRPVVGAIVLVCLPPEIGAFARARGYLTHGPCPPGVELLGKPIAAVAGDNVQVEPAGVTINGRMIPMSVPLLLDSDGRPLPQRMGAHLLRPGEVFLLSTHDRRSLDARYFGVLNIDALRRVVSPVMTSPGLR
jgi:conjugative transfer signal peptidase TraF